MTETRALVKARKPTPEEVARQNRAEKQLEQIDEVREKSTIPIEFSAKPFDDTDEATSLESLLEDYPDKFIQEFTLNDKTHKWHCERKSHFDIFPDADADDDGTLLTLYSDSVTLITAVVTAPKITAEQLKKLPVSLVTRISRGIQDEIMPRYTQDSEDAPETLEESE